MASTSGDIGPLVRTKPQTWLPGRGAPPPRPAAPTCFCASGDQLLTDWPLGTRVLSLTLTRPASLGAITCLTLSEVWAHLGLRGALYYGAVTSLLPRPPGLGGGSSSWGSLSRGSPG